MLWNAAMSYSPLYRQPQGTANPLPKLVSRVVLVIIDGLRLDLSMEMPCLTRIRRQGASAKSVAVFPSVSQPSWTTLVTGARPELNGAALVNAAYEEIEPIQVDHIFKTARSAGLETALVGQR